MTETLLRFFNACHPFGYPLLACSVALVSAIFYHLLFCSDRVLLRTMQSIGDQTPDRDAKRGRLHAFCLQYQHRPLAQIMLDALDNDASEKQVEAKLQRYMDNGRAGMAMISVITNIAPMLGILGTAWGLVDIFGVFGTPGAEEGIALGISKALYTTIFGLAIAVPGIISLTCFERGLERKASVLTALFTDILIPTRR